MSLYQTAKIDLEKLVDRFATLSAKNRESYNEPATRQAFILPLFAALGWDTLNPHEVSPEESISKRRVDYAFRLDGVPRFFLETKKIAVNLDDPRWGKQAITYSWLKGVTWAVLSDFAGLKIFNAEWQETIPARAIFKDLHWEEYLDRFDDMMLLSKEAIRDGIIDREAELVGKKVKKTPVDRKLFEDLVIWRHELFRHLRPYNPLWSIEQVDEAVQRILNRLIFIRVVEDRLIEEQRLIPLLRELEDRDLRSNLVEELSALFRELDDVYNARLFAPHFSESAESDPVPYIQIIEGLHDLPGGYGFYDFSAIDADVFGTIYEQYLGYVAQDPEAKEVVTKLPKRKRQGIYYTPRFVVKHIVQNTLGKMLEEGGLELALNIKVLDPACGSGSFLIEAFDVLDNFIAQKQGQVPGEDPDTDTERGKRILTHNLYGVDLDAQAVEITKLNLWLRAVNSREPLPALPNIHQGNSLIDDSSIAGRDNFNWEQAFHTVAQNGGFDIVIGNPPYGAKIDLAAEDYLVRRFQTFAQTKDVYTCFIELGSNLLREGGMLSYIVPSSWLGGPAYEELRRFFLDMQIEGIVSLPFDIFDAYIDTLIFIARKQLPEKNHRVRTYVYPKKMKLSTIELTSDEYGQVKQSLWLQSDNLKFVLDTETLELLNRLRKAELLTFGDVIEITRGVLFDDDLLSKNRVDDNYHLYFEGNVYRYQTQEQLSRWVEYGAKMKEYPKDFHWFEGERLLLRRLVNRQQRLMASYASETFITDKNLYILKQKKTLPSLLFILGILNSSLISYLYLKQVTQATKDDFPQLTIRDIKSLPFPRFDDAVHVHMEDMVEHMLALKKEHYEAEAMLEDRRHELAREIGRLDSEIDQLIYELYGLSDDEIALIEETEHSR